MHKIFRIFWFSAGILLIAISSILAITLATVPDSFVFPEDPVLGISSRLIFLSICLATFAGAFVLNFGTNISTCNSYLTWIVMTFVVYRLGCIENGVTGLLDPVNRSIGLSSFKINLVIHLVFSYFVLGLVLTNMLRKQLKITEK